MVDRPLPFTRAMALATWEGRKTQTRRILSIRGHRSFSDFGPSDTPGYDWHFRDAEMRWHDLRDAELRARLSYTVGDRLWVREPYWQRGHWAPVPGETTRGGAEKWQFLPSLHASHGPRFDPPRTFRLGMRRDGTAARVDWYQRLARFMPRDYSRQTGIITHVKVERVQDITADDAIAEGFTAITKDGGRTVKYGLADLDGLPGEDDIGWSWDRWRISPIDAYEHLWGLINGPESWAQNPWVVAVTYETIKANIDAIEARAA